MKRTPGKAQFVACISNRGYQASLVKRKLYRHLSDPEAEKRGLIRVIDESGDDYLFPDALFVAVEIPAESRRAILKAS